jgi:hypothetical protein
MINYTKEQILEVTKIHEEIIDEAAKITNKYNEIVYGFKSDLYIEELEIQDGIVIAKNNYDWTLDDFLITTLRFPIDWLYEEDSIREEKIHLIKTAIEVEKERKEIKIAEEKEIKQEEREKETLKRLMKKYPNYNNDEK